MNYGRISIVVVVAMSMLQIGAMEPATPPQIEKKPLQLISVSQERIDAYKNYWKNWGETRTNRRQKALYFGLFAATAYGAFEGYKWLYPEEETKKGAKGQTPEQILARIEALEINKPKVAEQPKAPTWAQWALDNVPGSRVCKGIYTIVSPYTPSVPSLIKGVVVSQASSCISDAVMRSPLSNVLTDAGDYIFRSRTMLWLLERDCNLRLALENIKKVLESACILLDGNYTYPNMLIIGINNLVLETEKVVGHMGFVQDLLEPSMVLEKQMAEGANEFIIGNLNQLIQATQVFLKTSSMFLEKSERGFDRIPTLAACLKPLMKAVRDSVAIILTQMELFDFVQRSVGLIDVSSGGNPVKRELDSLRSILGSQSSGVDQEEDELDKIIFAMLKTYMVNEGVKRVLNKIIPPFTEET